MLEALIKTWLGFFFFFFLYMVIWLSANFLLSKKGSRTGVTGDASASQAMNTL